MAASRIADVTVCSCSFSFSLSNSGLSVDRTGIARLAEGDNLLTKPNRGRSFDFYKAEIGRRAQVLSLAEQKKDANMANPTGIPRANIPEKKYHFFGEILFHVKASNF